MDTVYLQRKKAREEVIGQANPDAMRSALRRLLPYPCRSRYTAVKLIPQPSLTARAVAAAAEFLDPENAPRIGFWVLAGAAVAAIAAFGASRYLSYSGSSRR